MKRNFTISPKMMDYGSIYLFSLSNHSSPTIQFAVINQRNVSSLDYSDRSFAHHPETRIRARNGDASKFGTQTNSKMPDDCLLDQTGVSGITITSKHLARPFQSADQSPPSYFINSVVPDDTLVFAADIVFHQQYRCDL
jgi:hypothetical protein